MAHKDDIEVEPKSEPESPGSSPEPDADSSTKKRAGKGKRSTRVKSENAVMHRRSREGCYTCRVRRKKCDEITPMCTGCRNLMLKCEYDVPAWWKNAEMRKHHKNSIKHSIRTTKPPGNPKNPKNLPMPPPSAPSVDSPPSLTHSLPTPASSVEPLPPPDRSSFETSGFSPRPYSPASLNDTPRATTFFDGTPSMPAVQWTPIPPQYSSFPTPSSTSHWEVDIKTDRQTYINGLPSMKESTTSTFGTIEPATPTMMLPSYPSHNWTRHETFDVHAESFSEEQFDPNFFQFGNEPLSPEENITLKVDDCDEPLLHHFIDNVAPAIFSVFDAKQKGSSLKDIILPQLANNPIFLHCCLSTSALHLKVTEHIEGEEIDTDIIRHRHTTIAALCQAFQDETTEPLRLLEATLAMILFQSSVGSAEDGLEDIPWHAHFEAAANLIYRVQEFTPCNNYGRGDHHAAFNMTLAYWIDILGSTTLHRVPVFADTYRARIETDMPSGLAELMGCDDRVMYLISEIVCLDSLKQTSNMRPDTLCGHITNLGERLGCTEFGAGELGPVYTPDTNAIRPRQLSRNITSLFRFAARMYLCSLVPGFAPQDPCMVELLEQFTEALDIMPTGANGFDRALVWPLLVAGSVAAASSNFRKVFTDRKQLLGEAAGLGSYRQVQQLLEEVWRINDEHEAQDSPDRVSWRNVMEQRGFDCLIL